ncbi:hypothetical protein ACWDFR_18150 [Streptomyces sp. 900105755]
MISAAGVRFSQCAARISVLSAVLISAAGCGDAGSSAQQPTPRTAVHDSAPAETELPTMASLKSPVPPGKLLTAQSGQGAQRFDVPLAKPDSTVTVRLICLGPGAAKVTDGSGGAVLQVAGCNATAAYTTGFTGTKSDRVMRLGVEPSVKWRLLVWG